MDEIMNIGGEMISFRYSLSRFDPGNGWNYEYVPDLFLPIGKPL